MKEGLASYIDSKKATGAIEAILVGTRRGDPHGGQLAPLTPQIATTNANSLILRNSEIDALRSDRLRLAEVHARSSDTRLVVQGYLGFPTTS